MQALDALVKQTSAKNSLLDYEYADSSTGIGDVALWFQQAPQQNYENPTCGWDVVCRYGQVDAEAVQMLTNLQAMLVNLNDKTPASQPHQTDLQLMQDYGFMSGLVTVVSLREQVARAYQDGQLVYWSLVTTGRPELPTPPGVLYAVSKQPHIIFQPLGPIGPANGYPTPINYAVNSTSPYWHQFQGYYLHDAWWRLQFGPGPQHRLARLHQLPAREHGQVLRLGAGGHAGDRVLADLTHHLRRPAGTRGASCGVNA